MRRRLLLAPLVAAPWVAFAVVRGLSLDRSWLLVSALAFTPWAAVTGWVPVVTALVLRARAVAVLALVAWLVLVACVVGRARPDDQPAARGQRLTVMSANLYFGRADARRLVRLVREEHVDVLALVELTPELRAALRRAGLDALLPHVLDDAAVRASGAALFSRVSIAELPTVVPGPRESFAPFGRTAGVDVKVVHPFPPVNAADHADWRRLLRHLPAPGGELPRVLLGDFNATLDHRELRRLLGRGWRDAADQVGAGWRPTWPERGRHAPPITIDHVLVSQGVAVEDVSVHGIAGSDHRAVKARLRLPYRVGHG